MKIDFTVKKYFPELKDLFGWIEPQNFFSKRLNLEETK